jgi:hypothetical protein
MELEDLMTEAGRLLAQFSTEVKAAGALSHTDISTASDMFLVELFRETFGLKNLRNLNAERANFPGLDLADDTAGVAFQVTAERDLGKILDTLKTSVAHGLHKRYPKIRVFVTSERQKRYKQATIDAATQGALAFDAASDILDYTDLLKLYKHYELDPLKRIVAILRKHLRPRSAGEWVPRHTEALERDVTARFKEATDQGPFPEFGERNLFAPLAQQVLEEYREALPQPLCQSILLRAARRAAILKHVEEAERFLAAAQPFSASEGVAVEALIAEGRGEVGTALRKVRDLRDPESIATSLGILARERGGDAALDWMKSAGIRSQALTAISLITLSGIYLRVNRIDAYLQLLEEVPAAVFDDCPYLVFLRGILRVVSVFPKPDQIASLGGIPPVIEVGGPILAAAPLVRRLDDAIQDLQRFIPLGRYLRLTQAPATAEWFLLWAALLHPHRSSAARAQLQQDMQDFPKALHRVQLAFRYLPVFDPAPLTQYLAGRETLGGWDEDELYAAFIIALHSGDHRAVAALTAKYRARLQQRLTPQMTLLVEVQALALAKEASSARALLDAHRGSTDPAIVSRLEAEIAKAEGADPIAEYIRLYEKLGTVNELRVLVETLKRQRDHRLLGPYAEKLYAQTDDPEDVVVAAKAYAATGDAANFVRVIESFPVARARSPDLQRRYAWQLLLAGRLKESAVLAQELRGNTDRDVRLEIALAIETGQWEQLASLLGQYLEKPDQYDARTLIQAAHLAYASGHGPFRELMLAAVGKPDPPAEVLLGAYTVAVEGGLEEGNPAAHEWFNRALALSGPDGPVQRVAIKDLLAQQLEWNRHSRRINDAITHGEVPLVAAAPALRATLVDIILGHFLRNTEETDPRRRTLIPIFSGRRVPGPLGPMNRLALDISAVLVLGAIGVLPQVLRTFGTVMVAAGVMYELFNGQRRLREFQRSRVARAAQLQTLARASLKVLRASGTSPPDPLATEVGLELAALLRAAEARSGVVVRPAPVHRLGFNGQETADLAAHAGHLIDVRTLLDVLKERGRVDSRVEEFADRYFKVQDAGWPKPVRPQQSTALYLDDLAVSYLQTTGLLQTVVDAFDDVYIHASTQEEATAMLDMERQSVEIIKTLSTIREALAAAYKDGRLIFGPRRDQAESDEYDEPSTLNLLADMMSADVVVIDDRALNKDPFATDGQQHRARVATTLDVLEELKARGVISEAERITARHQLRVAGAALVPLDAAEVRWAAQRSQAVESAEFRAISESIALAQMREMPRFPAEIPWFSSLFTAIRAAIQDVWRDETDPQRAATLADLIFAELPQATDWVARWDDAAPPGWVEVVNGVLNAGLAMPAELTDRRIREAYVKWLDERVLSPLRQLHPARYAALVENLKSYVLNVSQAADDHTST